MSEYPKVDEFLAAYSQYKVLMDAARSQPGFIGFVPEAEELEHTLVVLRSEMNELENAAADAGIEAILEVE
jgi:hypothetical protein